MPTRNTYLSLQTIEPAKPLLNAQIGGSFFNTMKIMYTKSYNTPEQLVDLLISRGLCIDDKEKAKNYLHNIGYFRLTAYCYPLLEEPKTNHKYKTGATFTQILNMYRFDRKLRILVFNEIEKIEVAIRSIIVNNACDYYADTFWITNPDNFKNPLYFSKFISAVEVDIKNSSEDFIHHFVNKYSNPYPPAWVISEIISLGGICHVYKNISDTSLKKKISKKFGLQPKVFESWILTLAGLRNVCCHHGRLWNRTFKLKPIVPKGVEYKWIKESSKIDIQRVYYRLCIIKYLLHVVSPNNTFKRKLIDLVHQYPSIDIKAMKFPVDWQDELLWKN
ncbi:MAG: Abi family protein [Bacteroidales bacterium]